MAFNAQIALDVLADVRKYKDEISKIEGITEREAARAAVRMERELVKGQVKAAREADKAARKSAQSWDRSAKDISRDLKKIGRAAGTAFPAVGSLATGAGNIASAATAMLNPVGLAIAGMLAMAAAAAGAVLAVGAITVGMGKAAFAADDALQSLEGFQAIGSDFYPEVDDSTLDSIQSLNGSLDALRAIADRLTVIVGSNVAPAFERAAATAVGLGLQIVEMTEEFSDGKSLVEEFAVYVASFLTQALLNPLKPLGRLAQGILWLNDAFDVLPDGARESVDALAGLADGRVAEEMARQAVAFTVGAVGASDLGQALGDAEEKGRAFIATTERATAAVQGRASADRGAAEAAREAAEAQERLADEAARWSQELQRVRLGDELYSLQRGLEEIAQAEGIGVLSSQNAGELRAAAYADYAESVKDAAAEVVDALEETAVAEMSWADRAAESMAGTLERVQGTADQLAGAISPYLEALDMLASQSFDEHLAQYDRIQGRLTTLNEMIGELSEQQLDAAEMSGEAIVEAFKAGQVGAEDLSQEQREALQATLEDEAAALKKREAQEAAALRTAYARQKVARIGETTMAGIQAGIMALAQLGPIAGGIAAAGVAAATATAVGSIASTEAPFHAGGYRYPDERSSGAGGPTLLSGEGVLNRDATQRFGGAQGVQAFNAGGAPPAVNVRLRVGRLETREMIRTDLRGSGGLIRSTARDEARRSGRAGASGRTAIS